MELRTAARYFTGIVIATAALDVAVTAWWWRVWWPCIVVVALLALAVSIFWLRPSRSRSESNTGWSLGAAVELTDPQRPTPVANAMISSRYLSLGFLAIGAPGSGKTVLTLAYLHSFALHSPGGGWAYFEGKGDTDIYRKLVAMGSKPQHFFSTELPGSASVNLMAGATHDVVDRLSKILIGTTTTTSYYSDVQRAVLNKVVPLLLGLRAPAALRDLYTALSVEGVGLELCRRASAEGVDSVQVSLAREWFAQAHSEQLQQISGLLNRLFVFVAGPHTDRLNCYQPDIDIALAVSRGESVYFHLPLTVYSRDVAIALVEAFGVEARRRQLGGTEHLPTYPLAFDDWGAFFHEGFGPFSARCRSAAMPLSFSFQSRAQLEHVSLTYADELDDTIATKFVLRVHGRATGDYAVSLLGEFDLADVSVNDREWNDGMTSHVRTVPRIERRQLRELQTGEAFVSTLAHDDAGRETNPLWRLRLPVPPLAGWESVPMPPAREHVTGDGLGLWDRFMRPGQLQKIHAQTLANATARPAAGGTADREHEVLRLQGNPGFAEIDD